MKPIICILANKDRSYSYGVGRYIKQIIGLNDNEFIIYLILLSIDIDKINIQKFQNHEVIEIPTQNMYQSIYQEERYYRGFLYFIKEEYIQDRKCIFHINTYCSTILIKIIRDLFVSKIIFTFHSPSWTYGNINGNENKIFLISQKEQINRTVIENKIYSLVKKDIELISLCDKVIFVAYHTFILYNRIFKLPKEKCEIIYNGLPDDFINSCANINATRNKYGLGENEIIIIYSGRLDYNKGITFLIDSYLKIINSIPNSKLLIIGEGKYYGAIKSNHIIYTGFLEQEELYRLYKVADIGIFLSLYEEFGYVAIEMMMMGLPIIATKTTGLAEIIEDNNTGILIPIKYDSENNPIIDTNYIARKLIYLIKTENARLAIASNARKSYKKKFTDILFWERMKKIYNSLNI